MDTEFPVDHPITTTGITSLAAACGNPPDKYTEKMLTIIIKAGADVNKEDDFGRTPLHLAANSGNHIAAEMVLKEGADPNATTIGGETALMKAASGGHAEVVEILLAAGADKHMKSNSGKTA